MAIVSNKIYQTFREADFQIFDFETIRKSMIEYLNKNLNEAQKFSFKNLVNHKGYSD